jgi:hypothetical protein
MPLDSTPQYNSNKPVLDTLVHFNTYNDNTKSSIAGDKIEQIANYINILNNYNSIYLLIDEPLAVSFVTEYFIVNNLFAYRNYALSINKKPTLIIYYNLGQSLYYNFIINSAIQLKIDIYFKFLSDAFLKDILGEEYNCITKRLVGYK